MWNVRPSSGNLYEFDIFWSPAASMYAVMIYIHLIEPTLLEKHVLEH